MWVPLAVLLLATMMLPVAVRRFAVSESLVAFVLAGIAVAVLFQVERLA